MAGWNGYNVLQSLLNVVSTRLERPQKDGKAKNGLRKVKGTSKAY
jgi:hypothetical protein